MVQRISRWILSGALVVASPLSVHSQEADTYVEGIEAWHARRDAGLRRETGWLTVVGLFPVEDGENRFGAAETNDFVFPKGAPDFAGTIWFTDGDLSIEVADGVEILHDSLPVTTLDLVPDSQEGTTELTMGGRFSFYIIERGGRYYLRLLDRESERLKKFTHVDHYPISQDWRIEGRWITFDEPKTIVTQNVLGDQEEGAITGAADLVIDGKTIRLEPAEESDEWVWWIFGDATNEHETYGGGRYLYTDPPDSNGVIVLDFNKCYNPPCVFSDFATCPLPRTVNVLPIRIEAGELMYRDGH